MNPDAASFVPRTQNRSLSESDLSFDKSGIVSTTGKASKGGKKLGQKKKPILDTKDKVKSNAGKNKNAAKRGGNNNIQSRDGRVHVPPKSVSSVSVEMDFNFKFEYEDSRQHHRVGSASTFNKNKSLNKNSGKKNASLIIRMSRAQYCQANNRFVISPFTSVTDVGLYDADALLSWDSISCALIPMKSGDTNQCAICLNACHIPKLTHCGHSFCSVCIIRYLTYEDSAEQGRLTYHSHGSAEKKCPICNMIISKADLRSVKYDICRQERHPKEGTLYKMRLMSVVKGSLFPEIPSGANVNEKIAPNDNIEEHNLETNSVENERAQPRSPISFVPDVGNVNARFSRFIRSTTNDMQMLIDDEKSNLIKYHQECLLSTSSVQSLSSESNADIEYLPAIEMALEDLLEREILFKRSVLQHNGEKIDQLWKGKLDVSSEVAELLASSAENITEIEEFPTLSSSSKVAKKDVEKEKSVPHPTFFSGEFISNPSNDNVENEGVEIDVTGIRHYYYQDISGLPIFVHPMCMKALLTHAKESYSLPQLPAFIEPNVLEVEKVKNSQTVTFLKQVPLHINELALVEIDMSELISTTIKETFEEETAKRKKNRVAKKKASQKQNSVHEKQIRDEKKQLREIRDNIRRVKEEQLASLALDESLTLIDPQSSSKSTQSFAEKVGSYSKMTAGYFPALGEENDEEFPEFPTSAKNNVQAAWKR